MEFLKLLKSLVSPDPKSKPDTNCMTFRLDQIELERLQAFKEEHAKSCRARATIGGKFTYTFTPTGIGNIIGIRCNVCGKEKDITDIDSW